MFCLDCHHRLTATLEKAVGAPRDEANRLVHTSTLTQRWVCEVTGNEHRSGDVYDYARHVQESVPAVLELAREGVITAEQALAVLAIDLGFQERGEGSKKISAFLKAVEEGVAPAEAIEHVLS